MLPLQFLQRPRLVRSIESGRLCLDLWRDSLSRFFRLSVLDIASLSVCCGFFSNTYRRQTIGCFSGDLAGRHIDWDANTFGQTFGCPIVSRYALCDWGSRSLRSHPCIVEINLGRLDRDNQFVTGLRPGDLELRTQFLIGMKPRLCARLLSFGRKSHWL